jgi:hypothetical protein
MPWVEVQELPGRADVSSLQALPRNREETAPFPQSPPHGILAWETGRKQEEAFAALVVAASAAWGILFQRRGEDWKDEE